MVALSAFSVCNLPTRRTSQECYRVSIQWKCGTGPRNQPELASAFKGGGKSLGIQLFRTENGLFACKTIRKYLLQPALVRYVAPSLNPWKILYLVAQFGHLTFNRTSEYSLLVFFFFYTKLDDKSKVILSN